MSKFQFVGLRTFEHTGPAWALVWSSDQQFFLSLDGTMRLWETKTGKCLREFVGRHVRCVAWSSDRRHVLSASSGALCLSDVESGECLGVQVWYVVQYLWFVRSVPWGAVPEREDWKAEWQQLCQRRQSRHTVQLRITDKLEFMFLDAIGLRAGSDTLTSGLLDGACRVRDVLQESRPCQAVVA